MFSLHPTNITIRTSLPEDLDAIVALLRQLWPSKPITATSLKDSFTKSFTLEGHIIRVAIHEEKIVGLCAMYIRNNLKAEGNLANIDELVVDDKMRNKQIGKMLLDDAENIAREHQCKFLGLESSFHREDAHRFYEQNGYEKQGYYIIKDLS
ncbi:MAG: GNAT family N-acetyltransferase [Bacteroidota bacterium]